MVGTTPPSSRGSPPAQTLAALQCLRVARIPGWIHDQIRTCRCGGRPTSASHDHHRLAVVRGGVHRLGRDRRDPLAHRRPSRASASPPRPTASCRTLDCVIQPPRTSWSPRRPGPWLDAAISGPRHGLGALPQVGPSPAGSVAELIADEGRAVLVQVVLRGDPDDAGDKVDDLLALNTQIERDPPGRSAGRGGAGTQDKAIGDMIASDLHRAELISLPITLLILVLAFGALVAASVPLMLGVTVGRRRDGRARPRLAGRPDGRSTAARSSS